MMLNELSHQRLAPAERHAPMAVGSDTTFAPCSEFIPDRLCGVAPGGFPKKNLPNQTQFKIVFKPYKYNHLTHIIKIKTQKQTQF
jgi:hypothetical protein